AQPTAPTGLAERSVGGVLVRHRTHRGEARAVDTALLTRVEAKDRPTGIATDILSVGTSRTCDLAALAGLELDIVDDGTDRHALQRHGIAWLHVDGVHRRDDLVASRQTLRSH